MKSAILDCMDKGDWYDRQALSDLSGVARKKVDGLVVELVNEGLLVMRKARAFEFGLALTRSTAPAARIEPTVKAKVTARASKPTIATGPYRPEWQPMMAYGAYASSLQQLCEEMR
ncbi:hypothetical protein PCO31010_00812 [Pandoraea commovens]|uniref:Uncharacterized protein n=1 Tax=Pandoraea commovens TaxID=2508289 RepID=A0A5E4SIV6_9BURK|nr:hypothetical protein PCO31010_00812 [Pandoraea commovens]